MRICIYKYVYVCIQMNGQMDRWVCTYNPKTTYICKYDPKILNTRIYVFFMLCTHARPHTRMHTRTHKSTRVHMKAYIHVHNPTNTVVWVCACVTESVCALVRAWRFVCEGVCVRVCYPPGTRIPLTHGRISQTNTPRNRGIHAKTCFRRPRLGTGRWW